MKWQGFILPAGLVLTAEACARIFGISSDSLAAPSQILKAAWMLLADGSLFVMTGQTLLVGGGGIAARRLRAVSCSRSCSVCLPR